jgi:peptidylprolyl isomerase
MVKISKKDFIELDFTARVKDGEIFDTTIKENIEKIKNKNPNIEIKPSLISVGSGMVIKGLEKSLEGKEIGEEYEEEFSPEEAFGKRNPQLVKTLPMKVFREKNIQPQRGMQFDMDGMLVRIASASGGRVLADFNNPLSGKTVIYKFKVNKKVTDQKEKINALQEFFFKQKFEFELSADNKEVTFKIPKGLTPYIDLQKKNFEEILEIKVKTKEMAKKPEKSEKEE